GALAYVKHAWLVGNIAVEIAEPGDAPALEVGIERARKSRSVVGDRQRNARVVSDLHREQHGEVGDITRHRPEYAHPRQPGVPPVRRNTAETRAESKQVVPAGRVAQATGMVAAVGDWQHSQRQRDGGTPATAACRA